MDNRYRQLMYLFASSFLILFVGMGLFPILPLYAAQFGADSGQIGLFYALIYLTNGAGPVALMWLLHYFSPRRVFIGASILGIATLALTAFAVTFWQMAALLAVAWFVGGVILAQVSIYTGQVASGARRGRAFSLMAMAAPLGALVGGTLIGQIVSAVGYPAMFLSLAALWVGLPLVGLFGLRGLPDGRPASRAANVPAAVPGKLDLRFAALAGASLMAGMGISISRLGAPLMMKSLDFSAAQLASTATVSGLVAIPVVLLMGVLADRMGRGKLVMVGYGLAALGALILSQSATVAHFWVATTLMLVAFCINAGLGQALGTDLLESATLARGLSLLNTVKSGAAIASFAVTGYLVVAFGAPQVAVLAALLPVAAIGLLELEEKLPAGLTLASLAARRQVAEPEVIDC
jgi:MFS family permease